LLGLIPDFENFDCIKKSVFEWASCDQSKVHSTHSYFEVFVVLKVTLEVKETTIGIVDEIPSLKLTANTPENRVSHKENSFPTTILQGQAVSFSGE